MEKIPYNGKQDRQAKAIKLRTEGYNLSDIAWMLDYHDASAVWRVLQRHVVEDPLSDIAKEYRIKLLNEIETLRELLETVLNDIKLETDPQRKLDMIIKYNKSLGDLQEREAKLSGANAPEKSEQAITMTAEDLLMKLPPPPKQE